MLPWGRLPAPRTPAADRPAPACPRPGRGSGPRLPRAPRNRDRLAGHVDLGAGLAAHSQGTMLGGHLFGGRAVAEDKDQQQGILAAAVGQRAIPACRPAWPRSRARPRWRCSERACGSRCGRTISARPSNPRQARRGRGRLLQPRLQPDGVAPGPLGGAHGQLQRLCAGQVGCQLVRRLADGHVNHATWRPSARTTKSACVTWPAASSLSATWQRNTP